MNQLEILKQDSQSVFQLPRCFQKCLKHPLFSLADISLKEQSSNQDGGIFLCPKCTGKKETRQFKLMMREIVNSPDEYIIDNWPMINENILSELNRIICSGPQKDSDASSSSSSSSSSKNVVQKVFKSLKLRLIDTLNTLEESLLERASIVDHYPSRLLQDYIVKSKKCELKSIIIDEKDSLQEKSKAIEAIVSSVKADSEDISNCFSHSLADFKRYEQSISISEILKESEMALKSSLISFQMALDQEELTKEKQILNLLEINPESSGNRDNPSLSLESQSTLAFLIQSFQVR